MERVLVSKNSFVDSHMNTLLQAKDSQLSSKYKDLTSWMSSRDSQKIT